VVIERSEADLVEDHEVVPEQGVDDLPDGAIRQPTVEGLDEICRAR